MVSLVWIDKNTLVAGGHDCVPVNFLLDSEDNITLGTKFEEEQHNEEDNLATLHLSIYLHSSANYHDLII